MGFMGPGAGTAWHDGASHGSAFEQHFGLDGWIASGIEHLPGHDGVDDEVEGIDHVVTRWLTHESYGSPLSALSWVNRGGQNMSTFSNRFFAMRMLHTMLRVTDLERSLAFYTGVLGMNLLRRKDYPSGRFTLAFVGYGPETEQTVLELTHNWDADAYSLGDAYGHIALGVDDIRTTCAGITGKGGRVVREPGPMKHGSTVIAFVEDPDGYKVELIELSSKAAV